MEVCRACLSGEKEMVPLDESFVIGYNLLTNLNVIPFDGLSQYCCQSCMKTVNFYVLFREKCIESESTLRKQLFTPIKPEGKKRGRPKKIKDTKDKTNSVSESTTLDNQVAGSNPAPECGVVTDTNHALDVKYEVKQESLEVEETSIFDSCFGEAFDFEDLGYFVKNEEIDVKPKLRTRKKRTRQTLTEVKQKRPYVRKKDIVTLLSCGLCTDTFKSSEKDALTKHVESHKDDKQCKLCQETFQSWNPLLGHRISHIEDKDQQRCHLCSKFCCTPLALEYHYVKTHCEGKPALTCKHCSRTYDTPKKLKKHIAGSHSQKILICDYCNKTFKNKQCIKMHIRTHSDTKIYICHLCGFSCNYPTGLKNHVIWKHTPGKAHCKTCSRVFESQAKLDKHKCKEVDKVCPVCGIRINSSKGFSRHMETHNAVGRYKCTRCPAVYKSRSALKVHYDRHEGVRKNKCQYCARTFYSASVLIKHRRVHTGEKPYVCKVCHKGFTANHNLKVHMKVHGEYLVVKRVKDPVDITTTFK